LERSGRAATQEARILDVLNAIGNLTQHEITLRTGIEINAASGRINGLRRLGHAIVCGKKPGRAGTPVNVYTITPRGRERLRT